MNETSTTQLWQLKAFRGWLSAVQAQIHEARHTIDGQIEYHEGEIKRLRAQRERSLAVLKSMDLALETVDQHLTRAQDKVAGGERSAKPATSARKLPSAPRSSRSSGSAAKRPQATARHEEVLLEEEPGEIEEGPGKSSRRPGRGSHTP